LHKESFIFLALFISLSYMTSCSPRLQPTDWPAQHPDPFYNIDHNDYPLLHLPLIKPIEVKREDGRSPWNLELLNVIWIKLPKIQEQEVSAYYGYNPVKELEKFAVKNGVIMAYSRYIDQQADSYVRNNFYHWFVMVPGKQLSKGFHTEEEFREYIQTLGIQDPDWQKPDEAYEKFKRTGCLEWIPDCN
jgi:hypothetical protein